MNSNNKPDQIKQHNLPLLAQLLHNKNTATTYYTKNQDQKLTPPPKRNKTNNQQQKQNHLTKKSQPLKLRGGVAWQEYSTPGRVKRACIKQ